ncbi:zinc-ribbon domain-containing protein [Sulfitobacter sp. HGT1]|jgi:predicted Zn finger-like uncharacterized protein|uniref:zinc-ribbon domain-containing protein n=1 Tax=unclassified Sulfitobacter TaxID=196795 RepID=UPI001592BF4E|nr:zinc-ribbon domain-containing protein [Sulfitobacter sp. HGT1]
MRLICPNCDAQYEVPDSVMPTAGRDVQCSNCGQTWFQHHPDYMPAEDPEGLGDNTPTPDEETATPPPASHAKPAPERKQLDPSVADILRQEAEAEKLARRTKQAEVLESQPDLGLDDSADEPTPDQRARLAKARTARMRGEETEHEAVPAGASAAALASRRDLLPDIEEINSTLRTGNERRSADPDLEDSTVTPAAKREGGFKRGFTIIVVLALLMLLAYVFAPQLSAAVPQLEPFLSSYVATINQARVSLDSGLQNMLQWLDTKASQSGS